MKIVKLRPHHLLDLISAYGRGVEFKDPGSRAPAQVAAQNKVAREILSHMELMVKFVIGADDICRPCKHLQSDGQCDDMGGRKQVYNDGLDGRLFSYLGLVSNNIMTVRQFLEIVNEKVPGIEMFCSHPREDQKARLNNLTQGLFKLGIRQQ